VFSEEKMGSFPQYYSHFRCYKDFMVAIPLDLRHLPVYITETDQDQPWDDVPGSRWVQNAYKEIDDWNKTPGNQQIRCLILYRWPKGDKWYLEGKWKVVDDWRLAMDHAYRWSPVEYAVAFLAHTLPDSVVAGETLTGDLRIHNASRMAWAASGDNPVRLVYRWFRDGREVDVDRRPRISLPRDVHSGQQVVLNKVQVQAPWQAGQYVLQFDLLHEHLTLFSDKGSQTLDIEIGLRAGVGVPKPEIVDIIGQLETHPTKTYATRTRDQIRYLIVHHSGVRASVGPERFAQYHVQNGLPGIRYHFVIGDRGQVWQTNALTTISAHAEAGDEEGVGICVAGNFITDVEPPPAQMESLAHLCAWLIHELGLPPAEETVRGRQGYAQDETDPNYTWNLKSPGTQWDVGVRWKAKLIHEIRGFFS
jgi:hypothetical protein